MARLSTRHVILPWYGWLGLLLITVFWALNWTLPGLRTHWGFFPLWLGYCLLVDAVVYKRRGTSLITRNWIAYLGLFALSAPAWWLFEFFNHRLQNWVYQGAEAFSTAEYAFWATLSFSTVIPAVMGTAELASTFGFLRRLGRGPIIRPDRRTTGMFFLAGWTMLGLMWNWPAIFFPFLWIAIYFITEPLNIWLGYRNLAEFTRYGDWRPVISLWFGVLITAFFWEMWNYFAYPKWIYQIPWGDCCRIFEMPLLGYGGYLPFALELYALVQLAAGLLGAKRTDYIQIAGD